MFIHIYYFLYKFLHKSIFQISFRRNFLSIILVINNQKLILFNKNTMYE